MRVALVLVASIGLLGLLGCSAEATEDPVATPAVEPVAHGVLSGEIKETLDVSSYTYLRLETSAGEVWAAVPKAALEVGSQATLQNPQPMYGFESKALGRTFERIYFATMAGNAAPTTQRSNPHANLPGGGYADPAPGTAEKVDKAAGDTGVTVAELFSKKGDLSGSVIRLRGRVVKYTPAILGMNWIHLQDGSGDASAGNHDITVTTSATTALGEIIEVEGTVVVDKDFGSGYRYDVIVENAQLR